MDHLPAASETDVVTGNGQDSGALPLNTQQLPHSNPLWGLMANNQLLCEWQGVYLCVCLLRVYVIMDKGALWVASHPTVCL